MGNGSIHQNTRTAQFHGDSGVGCCAHSRIHNHGHLCIVDNDAEVPSPVITWVPPTDDEYAQGYMTRYLCRQSNNIDAIIIEIDQKSYDALNTPMFIKISVYWFISGDQNTVKQKNINSATNADFVVGGTKKYLTSNLLKYWKG